MPTQFVLNKDLVTLNVVDELGQLIWTTRYNRLDDFELTLITSGTTTPLYLGV